MSKFYTDLDLRGNELRGVRIQNLATPPEKPRKGMIYYDTSEDELRYYNGRRWVGYYSDVFYDLKEAEESARVNPKLGRALTVIDTVLNTVTLYVVSQADGTLSQVGSSEPLDYNFLLNKPSINGVTLIGDTDSDNLGIVKPLSNQDILNILSR